MRPKGAGHLKFRRANNNNGNELWMSGMVGGSERERVWSKAARATKNIAAYLWGRVPRPVDPTPWPQAWGQLNCYISATTLDYILCMQQSLRLVCVCVCVQGWGEAVRLLLCGMSLRMLLWQVEMSINAGAQEEAFLVVQRIWFTHYIFSEKSTFL